jgi:hypothetical protein
VITRALKVYSGASTKEYSRKVSYLRYGTVSTMRSPAFGGSAKRRIRSARAPGHREELKYNSEAADWKVNKPDNPR